MNHALVNKIVNAVLYEGYILYPYRPGSRKNRTRFTFGRVYPEAYSASQGGAEPFTMQTECLLQARADVATLQVSIRFLHPIARDVGALPTPAFGLPDDFGPVPELRVDGKLYQSWQEAIERAFSVPPQPLRALTEHPLMIPFSVSASRTVTPIRDVSSQVAGAIARRQEALSGLLELAAEPVDAQVFKITVRITNRTPVPQSDLDKQEAVIMRTFASTHTIFHVDGGDFLSLMDPPSAYANAAANCKNISTWPVLIGEKGERDAMLSSPIVLYDYPEIAPESPGDLCDATEIDEILTLRIMTMTDEEKNEMRNADDFTRRMLERTDALGRDQLLQMHGLMRDVSAFDEHFFNPTSRMESISVRGINLRQGDRVRIRPKGRSDVMDLALSGKTAIIEAIEQDIESRVHLALVLEDDPGKDLGMMRQPGHRFFYTPEEVEPVQEGD